MGKVCWLRWAGVFLLLVSLLLANLGKMETVEAAGSIYYIAKTGSDANPGTSALPWLTLQKAAKTLQAGDTVFVKAGTYRESVRPVKSGTDNAWISYRVYGTDKVVLDGTGLVTNGYGVFSLYGVNHILVEGFEICNSKDFAGVYVGTYGTGSTGNVILRNLIVHDTWNSGILINSSWTFPIINKISNVTIDNCEVFNTNIGGSNEGISLIGVNGFEIKNCRVHDIQGHQNYENDKEGIDCKEGCSNGSIHHTEVYRAKIGIYIDGGETAISKIALYNNKIHDNYDIGIGVSSEGSHKPVSGIALYNNLIYGNGTGFSVLDYPFTANFSLTNNTIYHNGIEREVFINSSPILTSCIISNNIIVASTKYAFLIHDSHYPAGITIDHNLFFNAYGYSGQSNALGTNHMEANPQLVEPEAGDYSLREGSPARDVGSTTGALETDYAGTVRPQGGGYDIGAYEYPVNNANQAPNLSHIGDKTFTENQASSFTLSATDPDGDPLTYSASNLPPGATFNASTHIFSWTPSYTQTGTYPGIHFQVSDGSLSDSEDITITVSNVNRAPTLSHIGDKTFTENQASSFTLSATDPDGDPLTYSASNLPPGATFNASTHIFSWTPSYTQTGTYSGIHFQVSDGSLSDSEDITITVSNVNRAPTLSHIGDKTFTENQASSFTLSATDPDGDPLTYSASNLPPGATFNASTHIFSWTPSYTQTGTYPGIHFQVSDGSLSDSEDITIILSQSNPQYDINSDGKVNLEDMLAISQKIGQTNTSGWIKEDVNRDGVINSLDMILIGQHWTG